MTFVQKMCAYNVDEIDDRSARMCISGMRAAKMLSRKIGTNIENTFIRHLFQKAKLLFLSFEKTVKLDRNS
jgi:hypothetical protein